MDIGQEKRRRVHQHGSIRVLGVNCEPGEHRRGERLRHRSLLGRIARGAAKLLVGFHQQELWSCAFEVDDFALGDLTAIEASSAQLAGAHAPRRGMGIEQIRRARVRRVAGQRDFEIQLAGLRVPVQRQQAWRVLHRRGSFRDGMRGGCRCGCVARTLRLAVCVCGEGRNGQREGKQKLQQSRHALL